MNTDKNRFRAWDKVGKCFAYKGFAVIGEVTALGGMETYIYERNIRAGDKREIIECWNDFILMQSTGLEDRLGKEIYEGDLVIVRSQYETDEPIECKETVYFRDGAFRCSFHDMVLGNNVCTGKNGNWNMEVIGNIYEHPELLQESK